MSPFSIVEQTSERRARGGAAPSWRFRTMGDPPPIRGILKKGRFSQPMPAVGAVDVGDDSTNVGNGRQNSDPPTATSVEQLPPGAQRAMTSSVAGAETSGEWDNGASCPRYFGSKSIRDSIAKHEGSVTKSSQEALELRKQFAGLAAAYDDDSESESGSDAANVPDDSLALQEDRVHGGERGAALALLSPVHPKMQPRALGGEIQADEDPPAPPPPPPPAGAAAAAPIGSRRSDGSTARVSSGRLSRFSRDLDVEAKDFSDVSSVHSGKEPSPLPTPEVSKHGTNEAWLFIKDQSQQRQREGRPPLRLMNSGRSEATSSIGAESDDGSSAPTSRAGSARRSGSGMHRSASIVSFRGDGGSEESLHDVHVIGSVSDLKKEKKGKKSSTFKWLKKEASALAYEFGLKKKKKACLEVDAKLEESRRNMVDNLDDTSVHNEGRRAWETRDVSLRGGEFFHAGIMRRSASSPKLHGGTTGLGDGDEADSPMSLPDGLERFTREENE